MAINYSKINWDVAPYKYANPSNMATMDNGIKSACDFADANANNGLGETSGGRNILPSSTYNAKPADVYVTDFLLPIGTYTISFVSSVSGQIDFYSKESSSYMSAVQCRFTANVRASATFTVSTATKVCGYSGVTTTFTQVMIESGSTATAYEPYYESNKMLTEDVAEIASLKYLGWTVPREMPIKNYVDSNGTFHQRVGRVDLGTLSWSMYSNKTNSFIAYNVSSSANAYNNKYQKLSGFGDLDVKTGIIYNSNYNQLIVSDLSYADATAFRNSLSGVYLYYELSSEVQIGEGNEVVNKSGIDKLQFSVSGTTLTITNGTTTWTINA